jgi:hypothetical protein
LIDANPEALTCKDDVKEDSAESNEAASIDTKVVVSDDIARADEISGSFVISWKYRRRIVVVRYIVGSVFQQF